MQMDQIFKIGFLTENMLAKTKVEALEELVNTLIKSGLKLDSAKVIEVLQQREKLGSTGIGDGLAIPHGKIPSLDEIVVAFGRSKKGVDFDSLDGKPVHIFFLLLAPENSVGQHLKALARISKMLKKANFRQKLIETDSKSDLYKLIIEQNETCPL
jgi:PTS system nitrogen regulatory IIA component